MLEPLDNRLMMAVTASFSAADDVLTVTGDAQDNSIAIAFNAAGSITVNGGAVPVLGGTPTAANTRLIQIFGLGGNDNLDWARSPNLPNAQIDGGAGNDTITSGTGNDLLIGGSGDDTYRFDTDNPLGSDTIDESGGGIDTLDFSATTTRAVNIDLSNPPAQVVFSPTTPRAVITDLGNPQVVNANLTLNLSAGNTIENVIGGALGDTLIGNSLNNVFEGGGGNDILGGGSLDVASGDGNDTFRFDTDNALGTDSILEFDNTVDSHGGVDRLDFSATTTRAVNVDLGIKGTQVINAGLSLAFGPDSIENVTGGALGDTIKGDALNNAIEGGGGNDTLTGGAGDDTFSWNPGDGSDVLDGQAGKDNVVFNGSDLAEKFGISDAGVGAPFHRVRLTRDIGTVALDLGTIEDIDLNTLGGADTVTIDDQTVTDLVKVGLDLEGTAGTSDGVADAVIINGTDGADVAQVASFGNSIEANVGLFPFVNMIGVDATMDTLTINALGGNDTVDATSLEASVIKLTINGGDGSDVLTSGAGSVDGGAQTDTINVISDGGASSGVVSVLPSSGDDAINVNADGVGTASVSFDATQRIGALMIGNGGVASVAAGGANVLTVTSLGIAGAGRLNLNNNQLVVDYAPLAASPIAGIRALLTSGYHNGAWDGNGIMSGLSDASKFALGFAEASDVGGIAGLGLDGTAVVVKFTLYGDANLDGTVDFLDLARLAQSFNTTLPATQGSWSRGDFNFDGMVDFLDLAKLAQQFNTSLPGAANVASTAQSLAPVTVQAARPVAASVARRPVRRHDSHDRR